VPVDLIPGAATTPENFSPGNFLENNIPTMPEMLQNEETVVEPARLITGMSDLFAFPFVVFSQCLLFIISSQIV
jgi:hypothetical protein